MEIAFGNRAPVSTLLVAPILNFSTNRTRNSMILDATMIDPTSPDVELTRKLGTMICRGPSVASICPLEGYAQLDSSPFEE